MFSKFLFSAIIFTVINTNGLCARGLDDFIDLCLSDSLSESDEHLMRVLSNYYAMSGVYDKYGWATLYYPYDSDVKQARLSVSWRETALAERRDFQRRVNNFDQENPVYNNSLDDGGNGTALRIVEKEKYDLDKKELAGSQAFLNNSLENLTVLQEKMTHRTKEFCSETYGKIFRLNWIDLNSTLVGRKLTNIGVLTHFLKLSSVNAKDNVISDLSVLNPLANLLNVDVSKNLVSDLSSLESDSLETLDVSENVLSELVVGKLPHLKSLNVSSNAITDISHVDPKRIPSLTELRAADNKIREMDGFSEFTGLRVLDLERNLITEFADLRSLTSLKVINLAKNSQLVKLDPALFPDSLEEIRLTGTKIESLPWPWEDTGNGVFKKTERPKPVVKVSKLDPVSISPAIPPEGQTDHQLVYDEFGKMYVHWQESDQYYYKSVDTNDIFMYLNGAYVKVPEKSAEFARR